MRHRCLPVGRRARGGRPGSRTPTFSSSGRRADCLRQTSDEWVARGGVEPPFRRSERRVLPLDDRATCCLPLPALPRTHPRRGWKPGAESSQLRAHRTSCLQVLVRREGASDGTCTRYDRRDKPAPRRLWLRRPGKPRRNCTPDSGLGNRRDPDFTSGLKRGDRSCAGIAGLEDRSSAVELHPGSEVRRPPPAPSPASGHTAGAGSWKQGASSCDMTALSCGVPHVRSKPLPDCQTTLRPVPGSSRGKQKTPRPSRRGVSANSDLRSTSRLPAPFPCRTGMARRISTPAFRIRKRLGSAGEYGLSQSARR